MEENNIAIIACSNCFNDDGLRLDAYKIGLENNSPCPICHTLDGRKLDFENLDKLAFNFFVQGSTFKSRYGAANVIQYNEYHFKKGDIKVPSWLSKDLELIGDLLKVGFFYYGPRLWRLGHIEPLKNLESIDNRPLVIQRIISEYPKITLKKNTTFYRLRKNSNRPTVFEEYDSPPDKFLQSGRLDSRALPILYGSQDLEVCIHECRVTIEDELYVANLVLQKDLTILDLTEWIIEKDVTEFESLNMAIHMLFRAPEHSYEIIRDIAIAANNANIDGIIYPSYYSKVHAKEDTIKNIGLFGRPIKDDIVRVRSINRLILNKVAYDYQFGPASF